MLCDGCGEEAEVTGTSAGLLCDDCLDIINDMEE